jgi:hypothetical protein
MLTTAKRETEEFVYDYDGVGSHSVTLIAPITDQETEAAAASIIAHRNNTGSGIRRDCSDHVSSLEVYP